MISAFEQLASGKGTGSFPLSRIYCRMDWVVESGSHVDDVIEFESRVNEVWRRHEDAVICTYHLGKFGGDAVVDIADPSDGRHRGRPQQNPFFVPPDEFLREFRERRLVGAAQLGWPDMEVQLEDPAQEIKRLRRCINDLTGLLSLLSGAAVNHRKLFKLFWMYSSVCSAWISFTRG